VEPNIILQEILCHLEARTLEENLRNMESFDRDASALQDSGRELLREYSGIRDEELDSHVEATVSSE
jgi:hypothetical protein